MKKGLGLSLCTSALLAACGSGAWDDPGDVEGGDGFWSEDGQTTDGSAPSGDDSRHGDSGPGDSGADGPGDLGSLGDSGSDADSGDFGPAGDRGPAPGAPAVEGELSAGHPRPSWFWSVPAGAAGFRFRIDGTAWQEVATDTTAFTAASDLAPGAHLFEVQARSSTYVWSSSGAFTTTIEYFPRDGFWNGVRRNLATTPYGHTCAVSAHNCYQAGHSTPSANLSATLSKIHAAQAAGADLIELDIKEEGGVIRVEHDDTGGANGARLIDVLDDDLLQAGDQILFLEIKEQTPTATFVSELIRMLRERRHHYARNGRPVVLRSFHAIRENVSLARAELREPENLLIRNYIRTSVLYGGNQDPNIASYQNMISAAHDAGHQMVEFPYIDPNLASKIAWAHHLGLGVNLWTVPALYGEVFIASLRDDTDVITTDYPLDDARARVEADNGLFYVDPTYETAGSAASAIPYQRRDQTPYQLAVNGTGQPTLATAAQGGTLYGGYLSFNPAYGQSGELYDADAEPGRGVLVSAVVAFDTLSLADGATMAVLSKTDGGGWCIELYNAAGAAGTVLRFGVRVGSSYVYATMDAALLNTTHSYVLTGAYDGDGGVRMWVNNSPANVSVPNASGGIVNNDSPVRIGADPVGLTGSGFHFDGRIQRVLGQAW